MTDVVSLRPLRVEDAGMYGRLTGLAGWGSGERTLGDIIKALPHGYVWGAFLADGLLVSAIVCQAINNDIGFIGTFVTDPDYRKQGIGKKVWFKCMEVLGDRNIFITAVDAMVPVYAKWGFQTPTRHGLMRAQGVPVLPATYIPPPGVNLATFTDSMMEDVMEFDKRVSLSDRMDVMEVFFSSDHTRMVKCAWLDVKEGEQEESLVEEKDECKGRTEKVHGGTEEEERKVEEEKRAGRKEQGERDGPVKQEERESRELGSRRVVGYIMLRHVSDDRPGSIRISAFYADNPTVAKALLYESVKELGYGISLEAGFSRANKQECVPLYEDFGLTDIIEQDASYCTKQDVAEIPWQNVFGVLENFAMFY